MVEERRFWVRALSSVVLTAAVAVMAGCGKDASPGNPADEIYIVLADESIMPNDFDWPLMRDRAQRRASSKQNPLGFVIYPIRDLPMGEVELMLIESFYEYDEESARDANYTKEKARDHIDTRQGVLCKYALVGINNGLRRDFGKVKSGSGTEDKAWTSELESDYQRYIRLNRRVPYLVVNKKPGSLDKQAFRNSKEFFLYFGVDPKWLDRKSYDLDW